LQIRIARSLHDLANGQHGETTMRQTCLTGFIFATAMALAAAMPARAQTSAPPSIDLPNPYAPATSFGQLPAGRSWGGTTAVAIDRDGKSVWVFERWGGEGWA